MFAVILPAIQAAIAWAFRAVFLKAIIFGVCLLIGQEVVSTIAPKIVSVTQLNAALSGLSSNFWYALDYIGFTTGFPLVIEAQLARFIIRRIPFFN